MADDERDGPLTVVCGVPGVGKSTVAQAIADRLRATTLRTDVVRKELYPEPTYESAETDAVYETVFDRAGERLPEPVVLDGTFRTQARRSRARRLADRHGVGFRLVVVECDRATAEERIRAREDDPSDADLAVHAKIAREFEPVACAHDTVDNSGSLAATREQVAELF